MEPSTTNELKKAASNAGAYASETARQVANTLTDKLHRTEVKAEEIYHAARDRAESAIDNSADFVKRHPFSTVAGAAAIGFIAGALLRRTRH